MFHKRIAVISYHTCPLSDESDAEIGGMNIYVLELSKKLASKGLIIDIYTSSQDPKSPRIVTVLPNLRVIHLPAGPEKPLPKSMLKPYIPEFLSSFYDFLKEHNLFYDVLSCHYYLSGIIGFEIKKKMSTPFIITFHTLGLMKNLVARSEEERESIGRIKTELKLVKEADQIIATSQTDANYIETLYNGNPAKISILTPGVDLELFRPKNKALAKKTIGAPPDENLILFVGRIEPLKGIDVLLYGLKVLLKNNPELPVCVWIVGGDISQPSDNWPKELKKLSEIREILGINTSVKFIGRKNQQALPDYYNAADLLVMPSHYESFGITAVEAMACGVPVITTDVTGVSDLFDTSTELITSANNPIMLADKIKRLLEDPKLYKKISSEVVKNVQNLSWKHAADQFISLCKSCANGILASK